MAVDRIPVAHISAKQKDLDINNTSWSLVIVGSSALEERKWVQIYNRSYYNAYYSYDNSVTPQKSFLLKSGGMVILPLSSAIPVYTRGSQAYQTVIIAEVA